MRLKKLVAVGGLLVMSILAVACGKKDTVSESGDVIVTTPTKKEEAPVIEQSKDETERVVASSVAVVQILDALDIPMVGVPTSSYELPESVADATKIGSAMSPDMEVIASLNPTVIVSVDSLSADLKSQFDSLNIESQFVNLNSYEGVKQAITDLGVRFGVKEKAEALVQSFTTREQELEKQIQGKESPSVLIIFGAGSSFMVASEQSYVGDLASKVGATNIVGTGVSSFSPVDMEYLADKNPDYILFMAHANPEESLQAFEQEFASNQAWNNFDAVKNGNVVALETSYFGMSANLLAIDAMEKLVTILYGE